MFAPKRIKRKRKREGEEWRDRGWRGGKEIREGRERWGIIGMIWGGWPGQERKRGERAEKREFLAVGNGGGGRVQGQCLDSLRTFEKDTQDTPSRNPKRPFRPKHCANPLL